MLQISKNYAILIDEKNNLHLFDLLTFEISLTISSFKEKILKINANNFSDIICIITTSQCTILDLENKKILKKLNISFEAYKIYFLEENKILINSEKTILYDLQTDKFTTFSEKNIFIFQYPHEIYFPEIKKVCLQSEIENIKTLFIEMKLQFSKDIYALKEEVKELKKEIKILKINK